MVLLTHRLAVLSVLLFPGGENTSLGLEGLGKKGERRKTLLSSEIKPNKTERFGRIYCLGEASSSVVRAVV